MENTPDIRAHAFVTAVDTVDHATVAAVWNALNAGTSVAWSAAARRLKMPFAAFHMPWTPMTTSASATVAAV